MKLLIRATNFALTDAIREYADRRCQFALSRFSTEIASIRLTMADVNGPKGGDDKRCALALKLAHGGELFLEVRGEDLYGVIDSLVDRSKRAIARHLDKKRTAAARNWRSA